MSFRPCVALPFLILVTCQSSWIYSQDNQPPIVKIIRPQMTSPWETGKSIPYEIEVEDPEDGYSIYDEIESTKVFLEWRILASEEEAQSMDEFTPARGLTLIKNHNCFTCHYIRRKYVGPSYLDISEKHQGDPNFLKQSIKEGSQGRWGDIAVMPAHPQLEDDEIKAMADWIASLYQDRNHYDIVAGTSGIIQIDSIHTGKYLWIKASYRDQGITGAEPKTGAMSLHFPLQ